jgi:hypothetical protein
VPRRSVRRRRTSARRVNHAVLPRRAALALPGRRRGSPRPHTQPGKQPRRRVRARRDRSRPRDRVHQKHDARADGPVGGPPIVGVITSVVHAPEVGIGGNCASTNWHRSSTKLVIIWCNNSSRSRMHTRLVRRLVPHVRCSFAVAVAVPNAGVADDQPSGRCSADRRRPARRVRSRGCPDQRPR